MKGLFHKFAQIRTGWSLEKADLTEVAEPLVNPARGWYQIHTFLVEQEPDFVKAKKNLCESETLVLVLINIGSFYDRDLDRDSLMRMGKILEFFAEHKKGIILRITYDHEGKALEREPSSFSQVQKHLMQLGELFEKYHEYIFVYQGMLIGNWGEMHTSRFLGTEQLRDLFKILKSYRKGDMYLAVRRPVYWRKLHPSGERQMLVSEREMGLYDDGIFGSVTNLGTFGQDSKDKVGWSQAWIREEELSFEEELCKYVPNGGEALYAEDYIKQLSQERVLKDLGRMHITYLNQKHDIRLINYWKETTYHGFGVWFGKSMYDYIGAHLGYRFWVKRVNISNLKGNNCQIEIEIQNLGFANLYQEADLYLEWTDENGKERRKRFSVDMRSINSGDVQKVSVEIEPGNGCLYLMAQRKLDRTVIKFANVSDETGRVNIGYLKSNQE